MFLFEDFLGTLYCVYCQQKIPQGEARKYTNAILCMYLRSLLCIVQGDVRRGNDQSAGIGSLGSNGIGSLGSLGSLESDESDESDENENLGIGTPYSLHVIIFF